MYDIIFAHSETYARGAGVTVEQPASLVLQPVHAVIHAVGYGFLLAVGVFVYYIHLYSPFT